MEYIDEHTQLQCVPQPAYLPSFDYEWPIRGLYDPEHNPPNCAAPIQLLTPPASESDTSPEPYEWPSEAQETASLTISTIFHPCASLLPTPPDVVLATSDNVYFYVHITRLFHRSSNSFNGLVPSQSELCLDPNQAFKANIVYLPDPAAVINVVLHEVYKLSCATFQPTIDVLVAAVDAMAKYGIRPEDHITPTKPLFTLILNQAPVQPIQAYAIAACYGLHSLAVPVSSHLLSYPLRTLTPELIVKIGPVYLKKLYFLHLGRIEALKRLIFPAPHPHPSTWACDFKDQHRLSRAWSLASGYIAWEARPDLPASAIESTLRSLGDDIPCHLCKANLAEHVKRLVIQWTMVKRVI